MTHSIPTEASQDASDLAITDDRLINQMCRGIARELAKDDYFSSKIIARIAKEHVLTTDILEQITPELLAEQLAKNLLLLAHSRHMTARDFLSTLLTKTNQLLAEKFAEEVRTA